MADNRRAVRQKADIWLPGRTLAQCTRAVEPRPILGCVTCHVGGMQIEGLQVFVCYALCSVDPRGSQEQGYSNTAWLLSEYGCDES